MPEAQIPIMIMTPSKSSMLIEKPKIKQHPQWEPYAFETMEFALTAEQEDKSEYCKFRKWLIDKVSKIHYKLSKLFFHYSGERIRAGSSEEELGKVNAQR